MRKNLKESLKKENPNTDIVFPSKEFLESNIDHIPLLKTKGLISSLNNSQISIKSKKINFLISKKMLKIKFLAQN